MPSLDTGLRKLTRSIGGLLKNVTADVPDSARPMYLLSSRVIVYVPPTKLCVISKQQKYFILKTMVIQVDHVHSLTIQEVQRLWLLEMAVTHHIVFMCEFDVHSKEEMSIRWCIARRNYGWSRREVAEYDS